jgi:hypothetical protein
MASTFSVTVTTSGLMWTTFSVEMFCLTSSNPVFNSQVGRTFFT